MANSKILGMMMTATHDDDNEDTVVIQILFSSKQKTGRQKNKTKISVHQDNNAYNTTYNCMIKDIVNIKIQCFTVTVPSVFRELNQNKNLFAILGYTICVSNILNGNENFKSLLAKEATILQN